MKAMMTRDQIVSLSNVQLLDLVHAMERTRVLMVQATAHGGPFPREHEWPADYEPLVEEAQNRGLCK